MTSKANISIVDKINKRTFQTIYNFDKAIRYGDLFLSLKGILKSFNYKKEEAKVKPSEVRFVYNFQNHNFYVDDWDHYILDKENVVIYISTPPENLYYLIDSFSDTVLEESKDLEFLYIYYQTFLKNTIDCAVLIKDQRKLIDVLDNPNNYFNSCVNRLVHKYNY